LITIVGMNLGRFGWCFEELSVGLKMWKLESLILFCVVFTGMIP